MLKSSSDESSMRVDDTAAEVQEMANMKQRKISAEAGKRFAARSTKSSAKLENRELPAGYVRSPKVERYLSERRRAA